jgi:long-chain acyl-CoA synthetase
LSVHWSILRRCLRAPGRLAIVDDNRAYRALELLVAAWHIAGLVRARCRTDTLGVMLPTGGAFPIAALGGWIAGKVVVPFNFLLRPDELNHVVRNCGTDTILTAGPLLDFMGYRPSIENLVLMDTLDFRSVPEPFWPPPAQDDELAVLLYTSGTSGRPKGVMLTHGNLTANLRQIRDHVDFTPRDSLLGVLPQFHSFGLTVLTLLPLSAGLKVIYSARFVPPRIVRLLREHRPTVFVGIPSMYNALLHAKDAEPDDFTSLRYVVSGGEPLPDAVFDAFRARFGVTINEGFGMTETGPVTNWCRPFEWRRHSVGPPLPGVEERIVDLATGRTLPPGREGELQIRGPNVTPGYFRLPEETAALFTPDGFLRSGDMARIDADGHLYITGRIKEMIIVGGENVFPREIEEVLDRHPAVKASGVVGVIDTMRGEVPVAFVEVNDGQPFDEHELKLWCRRHLAGYKVPDRIVPLEQLPRNATGKIVRRELRPLADRELAPRA